MVDFFCNRFIFSWWTRYYPVPGRWRRTERPCARLSTLGRVFSGIWSDPEKTRFVNTKVSQILFLIIKSCSNIIPIIFRYYFFADRPYHQLFQIGALKLGFLKKTVALKCHLGFAPRMPVSHIDHILPLVMLKP